MTTTTQRIAVIAGDGIGKEVIPAGMAAIEKPGRGRAISMAFTELPWGCEHYRATGRMMDEDAFTQLAAYDAIYLGAIGAPGVPDGISAAMILQIRQRFDQYVNLRPMRLLNGIASPLANRGVADIDMICVRENSGGESWGVGGRIPRGPPQEGAQRVGVFTRRGVEHILRSGLERAAARPGRLLGSATKSNALTHSMVMGDEIGGVVGRVFPA